LVYHKVVELLKRAIISTEWQKVSQEQDKGEVAGVILVYRCINIYRRYHTIKTGIPLFGPVGS